MKICTLNLIRQRSLVPAASVLRDFTRATRAKKRTDSSQVEKEVIAPPSRSRGCEQIKKNLAPLPKQIISWSIVTQRNYVIALE